MPLSAIIENQLIIGPDLSQDEWKDLKLKHKKGLPIIMSCCGAKGHLRTSKKGLQHFYHFSKSGNCSWERESIAHLELKNEIYQICKNEGWETRVEYDSGDGDWRADVYTQRDDKKIAFEVQLTKIPLEILEKRDAKYRKLGFESYWILKNKAKYKLNDECGFEYDQEPLPYVDTYFSNEPGCENPNKFNFFLPKGVVAFDIDVDARLLKYGDDKEISLHQWVLSILTGKCQEKLKKNRKEYEYYCNLRDIAKPILEEVENSHMRIIELIRKLKKKYAIFKNNPFENSRYIQEDFE